MQHFQKMFMPSPGDRNENTGQGFNRDKDQDDEKVKENTEKVKEKSKLDEALQQWSNDNARDIAEDDSTPLRSGL